MEVVMVVMMVVVTVLLLLLLLLLVKVVAVVVVLTCGPAAYGSPASNLAAPSNDDGVHLAYTRGSRPRSAAVRS